MSTIAVTNLKHESASGNNITLNSGGQVGVGTTTTNGQVNISKSGGNQLSLIDSSGSSPGIRFADSSNTALAFIESPAAAGLAFFSGSTERMRIDSSGRVTMPYQPAFIAYIDSSVWQSYSGTVVPWSSTYFNVGSHFNTSTGVFTAPVSGLYLFDAQIYQLNATDFGQIWLRVNGTYDSRRRFSIHQENTNADNTNHLTVIEKLNANDTIDLRVEGGLYTGHSRFSGCLLS